MLPLPLLSAISDRWGDGDEQLNMEKGVMGVLGWSWTSQMAPSPTRGPARGGSVQCGPMRAPSSTNAGAGAVGFFAHGRPLTFASFRGSHASPWTGSREVTEVCGHG